MQSFSDDELFTVWLTTMGAGDMLSRIPDSEATPPLFYLLEWVTVHILGSGEVAVRLLPAVAGTLTVPVVYVAAATAASRRAGLASATFVAVNPFLIWYSQEARAYAALILLVAVSMAFLFVLARGGGGRALAGWAIASAAALATHYFALFLIVPEAAWLLLAAGGEVRRRAVAVAMVGVAGLLLLPLALHQRTTVSDPGGLGDSGLAERIAAIPKNFLVGFSIPAEALVTAAAAMLATFGLVLALRAREDARQTVAAAGALAASGVLLPLTLVPLGLDYVSSRNVVAALVPAAVLLGCGFARGRLGPPLLAGLLVLSVVTVVGVAASPEYQRRDWRGAARALGPARVDRVVVFSPPFRNPGPFHVYFGTESALLHAGTRRVSEIAVIALAEGTGFGPGAPEPPRDPPPPPPPGFQMNQDIATSTYRLVRFSSPRPRLVPRARLAALAFPDAPAVFIAETGGA